MRALILILFYLAAVSAPLALSWLADLPPRSFRNELASALGMLAFAMILVEFVLSGRFRTISNGVGLDVTIRFHQLMARGLLVFALLHPFLYQWLPGPPRPWDPTRELTLTGDVTALASGFLAFIILPAFVLASINHDALGYKYERWRLLHGAGALALAGLLLHHTLAAGRYGAQSELVWFWSAMTGVAVLSSVFVYVVKPLYQRGHPWRVSTIRRVSPKQWVLRVSPDGHAGLDYKAGQFVWLNIDHSAFSLNENPFSLSSAPSQGSEIEFVIKELGDFTSNLDQVKAGDRAYVDGPYGTLTVAGRSEPGIALIAGGVGIAPMLSILRGLDTEGDDRDRVLIYGNRVEEQIVGREEIGTFDRTRTIHVLQEPPPGWDGETGFVSPDLIERSFDAQQFASWLFVICGPPIMMTVVEQALLDHGVSPDRVLSERFQYD
ncbi:putative ferric reductase [Litoreibacter ponti]|uniref:Putative ferric reductase n=1 Tax=Litoreibacter ponti TaxID=1510457 RepID=A0A2T6BLS7_9RHOB|nr:ferric reductase-like transmembrane domain-containing protein [Litoreibacter ponti]PTX57034.1 putative ferric reductase [Litoreibacter ponti]